MELVASLQKNWARKPSQLTSGLPPPGEPERGNITPLAPYYAQENVNGNMTLSEELSAEVELRILFFATKERHA